MRKQLTVIKSFSYSGRRLVAGDEFEAGESDARVLVAIGKAKYRTRVVTARGYATKDAVAAPAKPPESEKVQPGGFVPPIREFKRRETK